MFYAIERGDCETVQMLIDHGANVRMTDWRGLYHHNSLFYASIHTNEHSEEILRILMRNGSDPNDRDNQGRTALFWAQSPHVVRVLIESGIDVNARSCIGETALIVNCKDVEIIRELLKAGADVFAEDSSEKGVLDHCQKYGSKLCTRVVAVHTLKLLRDYFRRSEPDNIRNDVNEFTRTGDEKRFPLNKHHFFALRTLTPWKRYFTHQVGVDDSNKKDSNDNESNELLEYFSSNSDFKEKIWADVLHSLDEESILIDDRKPFVLARRRANTPEERDRFENLTKIFEEKRRITKDFYRLAENGHDCN